MDDHHSSMQSPRTLTLALFMILLSSNRSFSRRLYPSFIVMSKNKRKGLYSTSSEPTEAPPIYRAQGLIAVHKPLTWTSQDVGKAYVPWRTVVWSMINVWSTNITCLLIWCLTIRPLSVSYIRGILTRDAQDRNALGNDGEGGGNKRGKRRKQMLKVGHGGTLDPLASGTYFITLRHTAAIQYSCSRMSPTTLFVK